ncbi:MAG: hypothetical protein ACE5I7_08115 [Candidatus Binatia bacterium]
MKADERIDFELKGIGLTPLAGGEPRGAEYTGTKALMLAVLENGFQSYFSSRARIRAEAERWVANRQARSPFSFTVVCEVLGLEPDAVRSALRRVERQRTPIRPHVKRTRPNVHRLGRVGV